MTTANGYVLGFDGELRLRLEVSVSRSVVDSEDEGGSEGGGNGAG